MQCSTVGELDANLTLLSKSPQAARGPWGKSPRAVGRASRSTTSLVGLTSEGIEKQPSFAQNLDVPSELYVTANDQSIREVPKAPSVANFASQHALPEMVQAQITNEKDNKHVDDSLEARIGQMIELGKEYMKNTIRREIHNMHTRADNLADELHYLELENNVLRRIVPSNVLRHLIYNGGLDPVGPLATLPHAVQEVVHAVDSM